MIAEWQVRKAAAKSGIGLGPAFAGRRCQSSVRGFTAISNRLKRSGAGYRTALSATANLPDLLLAMSSTPRRKKFSFPEQRGAPRLSPWPAIARIHTERSPHLPLVSSSSRDHLVKRMSKAERTVLVWQISVSKFQLSRVANLSLQSLGMVRRRHRCFEQKTKQRPALPRK